MSKEQTCSIGTDYYSKTRLSNTISKEQALRILKLLSGLEMYVFTQIDVPAHHTTELLAIIDELTDIVLEKKSAND
jgi:hypothetical protein